jgi:uncharacterized protein YbjQ (UPF0145 family)
LDGYRIVKTLGVVRESLFVLAPSSALLALLQTIIGGNITLFTELCERRAEGLCAMLHHAQDIGANAVIRIATLQPKSWTVLQKSCAAGQAVVVEPV